MGNIFGSETKPDELQPPVNRPMDITTFKLPPDMTMEKLMGTCNEDGTKVKLSDLPTHHPETIKGGKYGGDPFAPVEAYDKEHHEGKQAGGRTDFSDTEDHMSDASFNKHVRGLLEKHHGGQQGGCNCALAPSTEQKGGKHKDKKYKAKKYYEESSDSSTSVSSSSTTTSDSIKLDDKPDSSSSASSSSSSSDSIVSKGVLNLEVGGTTNGLDDGDYDIDGGKHGISIFPFNSITTNKSDDVSGKKKKKYRRRT